MIEVRDVVKTFDGFRALDGVTMTVPRGAVYGLVGPNGAGKSTLIRHLTGIYRPDSGTIDIDGQPVYENPAVKARIAYIPDDVFYFPQATIPDMMRYYRGIYPKFDAERYQKLGEVFQLDPKRQIRRLSKGMQKQAAFWLALSAMPDYLILDACGRTCSCSTSRSTGSTPSCAVRSGISCWPMSPKTARPCSSRRTTCVSLRTCATT